MTSAMTTLTLVILFTFLPLCNFLSTETDVAPLPQLQLSNGLTILFNQTTFFEFFECLTRNSTCSCEMETDDYFYLNPVTVTAGGTVRCSQLFPQTFPSNKQVCSVKVLSSGRLAQHYVKINCQPIAASCSTQWKVTHVDCLPICWSGTITGAMSRTFWDYDECFLKFPVDINKTITENVNITLINNPPTDSYQITVSKIKNSITSSIQYNEQYLLTSARTEEIQSKDTIATTLNFGLNTEVMSDAVISPTATLDVSVTVITVKHISESAFQGKHQSTIPLETTSPTSSLQAISLSKSLLDTSSNISLHVISPNSSLQIISPTISSQAISPNSFLLVISPTLSLQTILPTSSLFVISSSNNIQASVLATIYYSEETKSQQITPIETSFTSLVNYGIKETGHFTVSPALSTDVLLTTFQTIINPVVVTLNVASPRSESKPSNAAETYEPSQTFLMTSSVTSAVSSYEMTLVIHPNATRLSERSGDSSAVIVIPCVVIATFLTITSVIIYCMVRYRRKQIQAVSTLKSDHPIKNNKTIENRIQSRFVYLTQSSIYQDYDYSRNSSYDFVDSQNADISKSSKRHKIESGTDLSNQNTLRSLSPDNDFHTSKSDLKPAADDISPYAVVSLVENLPEVGQSNNVYNRYFILSDSSNSSTDSSASKIYSNLSSDCETVSANNSFQYKTNEQNKLGAKNVKDDTFQLSKVKSSLPYTRLGDVHRSIENIYDSHFI